MACSSDYKPSRSYLENFHHTINEKDYTLSCTFEHDKVYFDFYDNKCYKSYKSTYEDVFVNNTMNVSFNNFVKIINDNFINKKVSFKILHEKVELDFSIDSIVSLNVTIVLNYDHQTSLETSLIAIKKVDSKLDALTSTVLNGSEYIMVSLGRLQRLDFCVEQEYMLYAQNIPLIITIYNNDSSTGFYHFIPKQDGNQIIIYAHQNGIVNITFNNTLKTINCSTLKISVSHLWNILPCSTEIMEISNQSTFDSFIKQHTTIDLPNLKVLNLIDVSCDKHDNMKVFLKLKITEINVSGSSNFRNFDSLTGKIKVTII